MFITLFVVLLVLWLLGFFAFHVAGGLIHLLLIIAVISLVIHFFRGRSPPKPVSRLAFGLHVGVSAGCPGGDHFCCFRNILGRAEEEQRQARHGTVQLVIGAETRCT